ncbi:MAG: DNA mismatch repair endonuclease MutL [candidate division WOR-3 bacterium]
MMDERPIRRPVKVLAEETVRRIAAGEVITRPAGAVKELIENSLDAAATDIRVEVTDGGCNLIRVTDNGFGMTRDDVRLAVGRHATSKLSSIDDLARLTSFGFRGEALGSIAAVSRMTVETNTDEFAPGTRLEVEAGEIREVAEVVHPVGTTVTARTLFYNLPARRSFLKSGTYELKLVVEVVKTYAVAYPRVSFVLIADGKTLLQLPAAEDVRVRLRDLYDRQTVESLVELRVDNPMLSLAGWVTRPDQARRYYEVQTIFFNGRPVRNRAVARAVHDACGPALGDANPNFILFLDTDPTRLDVNIHPTKQEVRFADERFLFDFVSEAVSKALGTRRSVGGGADEFLYQRSFASVEDAQVADFWQLHNSYILAQITTGYVIVDQHAAHERILFEELTRQRQHVSRQGLLFPINIELSAEQFAAYEAFSERVAELGLQTKVFSGRTVVVESVPAGSFMGKKEVEEFFAELAETTANQVVTELELAKLVACKAAIRAGQRLSQTEMESLCNRLFACSEPRFCPHGRPAVIKVSLDELARRFGRT